MPIFAGQDLDRVMLKGKRNVLFISHRLPYPPNKGEKIRTYNLIKHLSQTYQVYLGTLVDDIDDWAGVPKLSAMCAEVACFGVNRKRRLVKAALVAGVRQEAITVAYHRHRGLARWIESICSRKEFDIAYICTAAMAGYGALAKANIKLLDLQDIDSEKWM